jgi:DNA repair exonuclease SbcCD ATPase subunit
MRVWRRRIGSAKNWRAFKNFMIAEYEDYLEDVVSERNNPFNQASHVMQQETLATLTEIAEKFNKERATVTDMGEDNNILTPATVTLKEQVETVKQKLNNVHQKLTALEKRLEKLEAGGVRNGTGRKTKTQGEYTRPAKYCYTCGVNPWHHSLKCKLGMPGHKENATMEDKMGGNLTNHMTKSE